MSYVGLPRKSIVCIWMRECDNNQISGSPNACRMRRICLRAIQGGVSRYLLLGTNI
ncbi:hypothetical protein IEO21_09413 [Rhodonia placenta]|uniref:Uncharacterized protein n=1 Tax=Rhodonia placenta TaxID=104341 RepID=A0A8H7TXS1_9APHY|nr:hypothetical protein IEO21_09413 [Postia placenta]